MKMNCSVCGLICLMVGFMWVFRPRSSVKGFAPPPESNLDHCERHMPKVPAAHKAGRPGPSMFCLAVVCVVFLTSSYRQTDGEMLTVVVETT